MFQERRDLAHFIVDQVQQYAERIGSLDWIGKRYLLHLFGIRVFVYHSGEFDDGFGHRWRINYSWDGLNDIGARGVVVN